jgi:hypothetical protein
MTQGGDARKRGGVLPDRAFVGGAPTAEIDAISRFVDVRSVPATNALRSLLGSVGGGRSRFRALSEYLRAWALFSDWCAQRGQQIT